MDIVKHIFSLDVSNIEKQYLLQGISAGETDARQFVISLRNKSENIALGGNDTVVMYVTKPNASTPSINACRVENGSIVYDLMQNDVSAVGETVFQLKVIGLDSESNPYILYSPIFSAIVRSTRTSDSEIPNQPTYTVLEAQIIRIEGIIERLEPIEATISEITEIRDEAEGFSQSASASASLSEQYAFDSSTHASTSEAFSQIAAVEATKSAQEYLKAKAEADRAKAEADRAASFTPEGYEELVNNVADLSIKETGYATSHNLTTSEGGLGVIGIKGQTVKSNNLWNEKWEQGRYSPSTGVKEPDIQRVRSVNKTIVNVGASYYVVSNKNIRICVLCYKSDDTFISSFDNTQNKSITIPSECAYIYLFTDEYPYTNSVAIFEGSTPREYEPYGLISAGSLGCVDLGTLVWNYNSTYDAFFQSNYLNSPWKDNSTLYCSEYVFGGVKYDNQMLSAEDGIYIAEKQIKIKNRLFKNPTELKASLNGVMCAYETTSEPDKYALAINESAKYGKVDLGSLAWGNSGIANQFQAFVYDAKDNGVGQVPNATIEGYVAKANYGGSIGDMSFTFNGATIKIENRNYSTPSDFKNGVSGVILIYEQSENTIDKTIIIPLSSPLCSVGSVADEICMKNGKWGVLRRFKEIDLTLINWGWALGGGYWFYNFDDIKPATQNILPNIISDKYNVTFYGQNGISVSVGNIYVAVNNGSTTERPSGKFIYEIATPYFEPFEDQSLMYRLEAYDGETIVTTAEGLAEIGLKYGKSDVASEALRHYLPDFNPIIDRVNNLEFLGWNVPRECPIQNYKDNNGNFHQRVGRVDLGELNFVYSTTDLRFYSTIPSLDYSVRGANKIYSYDYTNAGNIPVAQMPNMSYLIHDSLHSVYFKNDSYSDAASFKSAMSGKYVYYELATEVVIPNGHEHATSISDEWVSTKAYTVGQYAIYLNVLYKCIANNTNIVPPNATYWKRVTVAEELTDNIVVVKRLCNSTQNISANGEATFEFDINYSGYTLLGVVGIDGSTSGIVPGLHWIGTNVYGTDVFKLAAKNFTSNPITNASMTMWLLFKKN